MALTIFVAEPGWIGLDEYIRYVDRNVNVNDDDAVIASAPYFAALLANASLIERVTDGAALATATRVLGEGRLQEFSVRATTWSPGKWTMCQAHDYASPLLIGGLHGPGCRSTIYECDAGSERSVRGEEVGLRFLEQTTLSKGKIMFFRERRDIHVVEPPIEPSISLELILPSRDLSNTQRHFVIEKHGVGAPGERSYVVDATVAAVEPALPQGVLPTSPSPIF